MTDSIADLITRIKNASMVSKKEVIMPYSKMKKAVLAVLEKEGYLSEVIEVENKKKKNIKVTISDLKKPVHLKQISKPGRRIYLNNRSIPSPLRGLGLVVVSTSSGVVSNKEAIKKGLGGEIICEIW